MATRRYRSKNVTASLKHVIQSLTTKQKNKDARIRETIDEKKGG